MSEEEEEKKARKREKRDRDADGGEAAKKRRKSSDAQEQADNDPASTGAPAKAVRLNGHPPPTLSRPVAAPASVVDGVHEVFVKFLPRDVTDEEVTKLFSPCGTLAKPPVLMRDYATGMPKGAGWVTFQTKAGADKALAQLNGYGLRGRHLQVTHATFRKESPGLRGQQQAPGTHSPALLAEILATLVAPDRSGVYIDATFGRGGHTRAFLEALTPAGRMHAFDMDPLAIEAGNALVAADPRFRIHASMFGNMAKVLPKEMRGTVSGILFDLGISSPQLDDPTRGFRPEADGPLDLRFDIASGEPAWKVLETASRKELADILTRYGDGQDAASATRIADAVVLAREFQGGVPRSTSGMAKLVADARCGGDYQPMHAAKLTFQALRIYLNDEFGQLHAGLAAGLKLLKPGGRMGIITWKHSECALVMDFVRKHEIAGENFPLRAWWESEPCGEPLKQSFGVRRGEALRPGAEELRTNARSRSAVLHVLYKEKGVTVRRVEKAAYAALNWESL